MKYFKFSDYEGTWWCEYRTSGMQNSITEKVVGIKTSYGNGLELSAEMIQKGLPTHLGDEVTEVGLKAIASAKGLNLTKQYESNAIQSFGAGFVSFYMLDQPNAALSDDYEGVIDHEAKTILVQVPFGTTVTALKATFTAIADSVAVGETPQVSGTTANNFTSDVEYLITSEEGNEETYTVTVEILPNTAAEITAFSFAEQTKAATIDDTEATIDITVANGTSPLALVATFTLSDNADAFVGETAQVSATTANDFSDPVVYTVVAEDGVTTKDWTVTVTIAET